jgi:hypothetical protein
VTVFRDIRFGCRVVRCTNDQQDPPWPVFGPSQCIAVRGADPPNIHAYPRSSAFKKSENRPDPPAIGKGVLSVSDTPGHDGERAARPYHPIALTSVGAAIAPGFGTNKRSIWLPRTD